MKRYVFIVAALFLYSIHAYPSDSDPKSAATVSDDKKIEENVELSNENIQGAAFLNSNGTEGDLATAETAIFRPLFVYRKYTAKRRRVEPIYPYYI